MTLKASLIVIAAIMYTQNEADLVRMIQVKLSQFRRSDKENVSRNLSPLVAENWYRTIQFWNFFLFLITTTWLSEISYQKYYQLLLTKNRKI